ncbi:MAG: enoyl-CoA hydratase [Pseudomonadota bacterium]
MAEVLLERPSEHVVLVKLNRPEVRNALNMATRTLLAEHFTALGGDPAVRVIVLAGNDQAFAAGADINEMKDASPVDLMLRNVQRLWAPIATCPKPMIAAVNGFALGGGCELAMHCDIIIAGAGAKFGLPEVRIGIMPGAGGTQRLTRAVGKFQAMRMIMTGAMISGDEALRIGLASEVVPDAEVLPTALKMASQIAALPPLSLMSIKEAVLAGEDASLETGLLLERKAMQILFASRDQKEGAAAFLGKRKPEFEGR